MRGTPIPLAALGLCALLCGCSSPAEWAGLGAGVTAGLGRMPSHDIEQTYYVGVFDARNEQVPPALYRITVRGQASFISSTKFASGWVPSQMIDSLGTRLRFNEDGEMELTGDEGLSKSKLQTGRGLMMFGPEGFRRAPRDHRLVIVMGSDPSEYFQAVEEAMGEIAAAQRLSKSSIRDANNRLIGAMLAQSRAKSTIDAARADVDARLPAEED